MIYDPKRPQEVTLPERLPKGTRGLLITMLVSGAVVVGCVTAVVVAAN
ncbi:hypothetical protein [Streptomyces sp. AP-93]|nr:hypothetical protein [Streptomyces sp. AP-93]MCJ0871192.1 hypothetical protein [Streptomyces sp. AP-93]